MVIHTLFSEMDNLSCFSRGLYRYLDIPQQVDLAKQMVDIILASSYRRVIVVETGAAPLARIMQEVLKQRNEDVSFYFLKLPRELEANSYASFRCASLSDFISQPFLIFDEYIDSGHTMKLVIDFLQAKDFELLAYMSLCEDPFLKQKLYFAFADRTNCLDHFQKGAYPFENRLDYAPYFHFKGQKISLEQFLLCDCIEECEVFLEALREKIHQHKRIIGLDPFITDRHWMLYTFYCWETDPMRKEFFWLLFDMYGPCWTPLPDTLHFTYWQIFDAIRKEVQAFMTPALQREFFRCRKSIAHHAAARMLQRHHAWFEQVKQMIHKGGHYVEEQNLYRYFTAPQRQDCRLGGRQTA